MKLDLAIIMIEGDDLPTMQMGDSDKILPGELVYSLGYPWGIQGGLTYGIVIQNGPWPAEDRQSTADLKVASLHLRPGHSGGPMFNSRGEG